MPELISAIAELWKLALIVLLFSGMLIYRRQVAPLLERFSRFSLKRGQTEVLVEGKATVEEVVPIRENSPPAAEPPPPKTDQLLKELPPSKPEQSAFDGMFDALNGRRFEEAKNAFEVLQNSAQDLSTKLRNEVIYESFSYVEGNPDASLSRVEEIAENDPTLRAYALGFIGWAYARVSALEQARDAYSRAIAASSNDNERAEHVIALANLHRQTSDFDQSARLLFDALATDVNDHTRGNLYRAAASIFKETGEKVLCAVALEKAVELNPSDLALRFSAAYAESEADLDHLASANYETLIQQDPSHGVAMNNLGVLAVGFKLDIRSVAFYESASSRGETLAAANLAYKLLDGGFVDSARRTLAEVQSRPEVHPNVNEAFASASKRETAENNAWKEILKNGAKHRLFLHSFADAHFSVPPVVPSFSGTWNAPDGSTFPIVEDDGKITAIWGQQPNTLMGVNTARKLEGRRTNRAVAGVVRKWQHLAGASGYYEYSGTKASCVHFR